MAWCAGGLRHAEHPGLSHLSALTTLTLLQLICCGNNTSATALGAALTRNAGLRILKFECMAKFPTGARLANLRGELDLSFCDFNRFPPALRTARGLHMLNMRPQAGTRLAAGDAALIAEMSSLRCLKIHISEATRVRENLLENDLFDCFH